MKSFTSTPLVIAFILASGGCSLNTPITTNATFPPEENLYILSPHPDDGPLTFGGLLSNIQPDYTNKHVYYTTFTNISNYTVHGGGSIELVTGTRYLEDINALDLLLKSSSGIRRYSYSVAGEKDAPLVDMQDGRFENFNPAAITAFNNTYNYIYRLMDDASRQGKSCAFFVNAALPNPNGKPHSNHFILREATIKALHNIGNTRFPCRVYLGEDLPYYINNEPGSIETIEHLKKRLTLKEQEYEFDIDRKVETIQKYPSQLTPDYENSVIMRHSQLGGKERVYLISPSNYKEIHTDPSCKESYCKY